MFILARNLTLNSLKKISHEWLAREKWVREQAPSENSTDYKVLNAQYQQLLEQAIGRLSPLQQQVYRLAREQGLSYKEIGGQLSISPLTVKTHMARAMASIRTFLQENGIVPALLVLAGWTVS